MSTIFRPYTPTSQRSDRSARDRTRHREKIKEAIRHNIGDIIAEESIIGRDKDKIIKEDTTKYGEFVSSYFEWITPDEQKQKAKELEQLGKKDKK